MSSLDDKDDASVWSMQVNASTCDELEDFEEFGAIYDDGDVDEFCDIMSEICVNDGAEFSGKDERFVNDIDLNASTCDELEDFKEFGAIYDDGDVDELCDIMSEICVNDGAEFSGKDERFVNDIDCEIKGDS
ncbi:hypothetical protein Tco_0828286 [Tanacetum coccineum]